LSASKRQPIVLSFVYRAIQQDKAPPHPNLLPQGEKGLVSSSRNNTIDANPPRCYHYDSTMKGETCRWLRYSFGT